MAFVHPRFSGPEIDLSIVSAIERPTDRADLAITEHSDEMNHYFGLCVLLVGEDRPDREEEKRQYPRVPQGKKEEE